MTDDEGYDIWSEDEHDRLREEARLRDLPGHITTLKTKRDGYLKMAAAIDAVIYAAEAKN